jgi:hypothetical protein
MTPLWMDKTAVDETAGGELLFLGVLADSCLLSCSCHCCRSCYCLKWRKEIASTTEEITSTTDKEIASTMEEGDRVGGRRSSEGG